MSASDRYVWPAGGVIAGLVLAGAGVLTARFAWTRDTRWFELHASRLCCITDPRAAHVFPLERWAGVSMGVLLVLVAWPVARSTARVTPRALASLAARCAIAAVLALLACEGILRALKPVTPPVRTNLPTADPDEKLAWRYRASTAKFTEFPGDGLTVEYDMDVDGDRARSTTEVPDRHAPTILFPGESITVGVGVAWQDTYPAIVERRLGVQSVNLGVHAWGFDQVYLRTLEALDTFRHPVAVVTLVLPDELERPVVLDRVHLTLENGALVLERSPRVWRESTLRSLFLQATHYENGAEIELARTILQKTVARARERGAIPLFVMTNFELVCVPDASGESAIEHALFDDLGAPHLHVDLDPTWRLHDDPHPDARGSKKLAEAMIGALTSLGIGSEQKAPARAAEP